MTSKPTAIILSGFVLVILLVTALLGTSLHQIDTSNDKLQSSIEIKSRHSVWINNLLFIATRRSELMLEILHTEDAFDRYDLVQELYHFGQSFMQTREKFLNSTLDQYEKNILVKHAKLITEVVNAQHEVIRLRNLENYQLAHHHFMSIALPKQQENAKHLNQLSSYQSEQINRITAKSINQQRDTYLLILSAGISVIFFCVLIAWFIYIKLTHNVSEIQQARNDLSSSLIEQENLLYALNQHAIVSITDTDGVITFVNEKVCEVSQYNADELLGNKHSVLNSGYHSRKFFRDMWVTIQSGLIWQGELRNKKKDGSYYWVESTIVPFLDKNDVPYQYIAIRTDITNIKNTESELEFSLERLALEANRAQESSELKESIISTMTHELRTPLNSILGFSQLLLLENNNLSEAQIDDINSIKNSGNELLNNIENIMLYSKLKSNSAVLQYSEVELEILFQSIIDEQKTKANKEIVLPSIKADTSLYADSDGKLLRKAFAHVIDNAIKFTRSGSINIHITEYNKNSPLPCHPSVANTDLILITIKDTGIGISPEKLQLVFDDFRQADEKDNRQFEGFGIGLSLTKNIINLHKGEIWMTSEVNKGTTVYITIPVKAATSSAS